MNVVLTGASGFVGSHLARALRARSDRTISITRSLEGNNQCVTWNSSANTPCPALISAIQQSDAVIHLAGENIASGRWTRRRKLAIRESRVRGTEQIVAAIDLADRKPRVFLCASAVGYYGNRCEEELNEASAPGEGWLSEVCKAWEDRAAQARSRVVHLRFGMILSKSGGALAKMIWPFQLGLGGPLGKGSPWMSWITIDDAVRAILYLLDEVDLRGPVNVVAPTPVRNKEFTQALAKVLRKPAVFRVPETLLRIVFGEMAEELLLSSQCVKPTVLETSGFRFHHRTIQNALSHLFAP